MSHRGGSVRAFFSLLIAIVCSATAHAADPYPSRPITLVVFLPAGAIPDLIGRLIGDGLSQRLGQQVLVENPAGGDAIPGTLAVGRATPDGYTVL